MNLRRNLTKDPLHTMKHYFASLTKCSTIKHTPSQNQRKQPFFDDILIYSRGIVEHLQHTDTVLEILREHKLYANKKNAASLTQE